MTTTRSGKESNPQGSAIEQAAGTKHQIKQEASPPSKRTKNDSKDEPKQEQQKEKIPADDIIPT